MLAELLLALAPSETVVVASKNFSESVVLGELMAQLIEARTEHQVEHRRNLGGTLICFSALTEGEVDLYAEYTGTAWATILERGDAVGDPMRTFTLVQQDARVAHDLEWLSPFGFDNTYVMAVRESLAAELDLETLSDLVPHADSLRGAFSIEFTERADGWPGLSAAYGLELGEIRPMEHGLAYQALAAGDVDLIDAYATDGKLVEYEVRTLRDDLGFFPPYDAAPVARADLFERAPELRAVLADLAFVLDDASMRGLNHAVEARGRTAEEVARGFLAERGLIGADAAPAISGPSRASFAAFMRDRAGITAQLAGEHLGLTLVSVVLAALAAVPAGIALARRELLSRIALAAAGVLQTIPSLALLAFMIAVPGLGLSARSAIAALFLYALLPILRNTITGMRGVEPQLVDAARGLGLTERQVWLRIQLPLAVPTIMAGVRTAAVISVGVATLAAFIGAGGLGGPIVNGLYLNDTYLILAGALPAAVLALGVDRGLGWVETRITPRGIRGE